MRTDEHLERGTLGAVQEPEQGLPVLADVVVHVQECRGTDLQLGERAAANQIPGAGVALVQNIGGTGATVASHVLIRDS